MPEMQIAEVYAKHADIVNAIRPLPIQQSATLMECLLSELYLIAAGGDHRKALKNVKNFEKNVKRIYFQHKRQEGGNAEVRGNAPKI